MEKFSKNNKDYNKETINILKKNWLLKHFYKLLVYFNEMDFQWNIFKE
jgi:hypothetical protein